MHFLVFTGLFVLLATSLLYVLDRWVHKSPRKERHSRRILAFCVLFCLALFVFFQKCLYHDATWNYGYLRSVASEQDLDFYEEFILHNAYSMYAPHPNDPVFHTGGSFFQAPLFAVGQVASRMLGFRTDVFQDGYGWPTVLATSLTSVFASLLCCICLFQLFRRFVRADSAWITTCAVFFCGNLIFFAFFWPLYTHPYSLLCTTLFVLIWLRIRKLSSWQSWALWGAVLGLAVWTRPQTIFYGLLPLIEVFRQWRGGCRKGSVFGKAFAFGVAFLFCLSPQMMLWVKTTGYPVIDAYAQIDDEFFWTRPRFLYLLFSPRKGFFSWNPVYLLMLPGLWLFLRRWPGVARPLGVVFALQFYLVACYEFPEGGAGYGSRYLIDALPFIGLCMALAIESIRRNWGTRPLGLVLIVLAALNLLLAMAYHSEKIPHNNYTPSWSELVAVIANMPSDLPGALVSTHINENVFFAPVWQAFAHGHPLRALLLILLFSGLALFLGAFALIVGGRKLTPHFKMDRVLIALVLGISIANVWIARADTARDYTGVYPVLEMAYDRQEALPAIEERSVFIGADNRTLELIIPYPFRVQEMDLVTSVVDSEDLRSGEVVMTVEVHHTRGPPLLFDLQYKKDTADFRLYQRHALEPDPAMDRMRSRAVHRWMEFDEVGRPFYGAGYKARYTLSHPLVIRKLVLRYRPWQGELLVSGIHFRAMDPDAGTLHLIEDLP